jgi:hypothetical protein
MKTLQLLIIVIAFSVLILNWVQVEGKIVPQTIMQLYKESDIILVGNVTSMEITSSGIHTFYHIKVEQYLKSPELNDTITVVGSGPNGGHPPPDPKFMVGDRVRLYLYEEDGMHMISMYSTTANPKCYAHELLGLGPREPIPRGGHDPNYSEINCGPPYANLYPNTASFLPPTIQFKSGIQAASIACNEGFQLIIKNENNLPACVKPSSIKKLVLSNWALKPSDELTLEGLKATYRVGEQIDFTINFRGFAGCGYPEILVKNKNNETIWSSNRLLQLCDSDTGYGVSNWKVGNSSLGTLLINQTGIYNLDVSMGEKTIEKEFSIISSQMVEQSRTLVTNPLQCENKFKPKPFEHIVFPNGTSLTVNYVPVFLMKPDSIGKICITNWSIDKSSNYSGKTTAGVSKDNSVTSDVTIVPYPESITIDSNTNKTIVYTITTSKEANGFYRTSPMFDYCANGLPLAVGYNSSHSFDNDFPWLWESLPCPFNPFARQVVGLTGIDVAYITKVYN